MGTRGSEAAPSGLPKSSVYGVVWTKESGTFVKNVEDSFNDEGTTIRAKDARSDGGLTDKGKYSMWNTKG